MCYEPDMGVLVYGDLLCKSCSVITKANGNRHCELCSRVVSLSEIRYFYPFPICFVCNAKWNQQ